jgi:hypothetical protein
LTSKNSKNDDAKDSDIDPSSGKSDKVKIENGDNLTLDGGIYRNPVVESDVPNPKIPKIDIEKHTNGKDADVESSAVALIEGDNITWEYIVKNVGTETLVDIKVVDDKEGNVNCPKATLEPSEEMICKLEGVAKEPRYQNRATVTAKGEDSNKEVSDSDSSWYTTKYLIGTHFWVDTNKDGIYQEGVEEPIPNALVELFNADGEKIAETTTNEKGEYRFFVDAGEYYVKFHLPESFKKKGYIFDEPKGNDDNHININSADHQGLTRVVSVGPNADPKHIFENLTLDAGINCGCDAPGIAQGSGDAFGRFTAILMLLATLLFALREIEIKRVD